MHYLIYKIINLINGKIYIGKHKTKNIDDGYMGSGKLIKLAIKNYGIENFQKEILFEASSEKEMFDKEEELVEIGPHSYNLKEGGYGGWDYINNLKSVERKQYARMGRLAADKILEEKYGTNWRSTLSQKANDARKIKCPNHSQEMAIKGHKEGWFTFKGRTHSDETKSAIGKANSQNVGEKSSQYGTMWITNETANRKIKKDEMIPEGWRKGRIIKFCRVSSVGRARNL